MSAIFIVVMGVSGCGKSTLGTSLAEELNMPFFDADDLHPKSNIEKMSKGYPLSDADREPWLQIVRTTAEQACAEQALQQHGQPLRGVVIACSALKKHYRDILRGRQNLSPQTHPSQPRNLSIYVVYISGTRELLLERMSSRQGHFMKANMLDSQLQTLENPGEEEGVIIVHLKDSTEKQVRIVKEQLFSLLGTEEISSQC